MKPERRQVNFVFNPQGGCGKSLTADYITLNPCFNALLAPQLSSPERWVAAFIDQLEQYLEVNKRLPLINMLSAVKSTIRTLSEDISISYP